MDHYDNDDEEEQEYIKFMKSIHPKDVRSLFKKEEQVLNEQNDYYSLNLKFPRETAMAFVESYYRAVNGNGKDIMNMLYIISSMVDEIENSPFEYNEDD